MTEYWVSQGNKWCDYCKIYISNNAASIRTHELGLRHKDSVAKRIAGIRKDNAVKEKEHWLAVKDMKTIEAQAKKSYEKDLAATRRVGIAPENALGSSRISSPTSLDSARGSNRLLSATSQAPTTNAQAPSRVNRDGTLPGKKVSSAPVRFGKGVASSLEVGKRKRVEKGGVASSEETAALIARESAKKRVQEREKSLLGLYDRY